MLFNSPSFFIRNFIFAASRPSYLPIRPTLPRLWQKSSNGPTNWQRYNKRWHTAARSLEVTTRTTLCQQLSTSLSKSSRAPEVAPGDAPEVAPQELPLLSSRPCLVVGRVLDNLSKGFDFEVFLTLLEREEIGYPEIDHSKLYCVSLNSEEKSKEETYHAKHGDPVDLKAALTLGSYEFFEEACIYHAKVVPTSFFTWAKNWIKDSPDSEDFDSCLEVGYVLHSAHGKGATQVNNSTLLG